MKLTYFLSHPIQYISPLLQELAKEVDLEVYYYSKMSIKGGFDKGFGKAIKWDTPLLEGYKSTFLRNYSKSNTMNCSFGDALNFGFWNVLRKSKSKIVLVNSWVYGTDLMVILTAWLFGKKVWLRAETPFNQEIQKKGLKQILKHFVLKYVLFKIFISKFLYIGTENKKFYNYMGVLDSKLLFTPYAVDNQKFSAEYFKHKDYKASQREAISIPMDSKVILYSGKYIAKKRPLDLVKAFKIINTPNVHLVLMGDGPLRNEIEENIQKNKLPNVHLTGFVNQSEISKYYSVADVFVMCSGIGETWGLSTNEAMNFRLPIILSNTTGSSRDLVQNGKNGFVFPEGNIAELAQCIDSIFSDSFDTVTAGEISFKLISNFSINVISDNILMELKNQN